MNTRKLLKVGFAFLLMLSCNRTIPTPTAHPSPTPTLTATITATHTPEPTRTATLAPTDTPVPTPTFTPSPSSTSTPSPTPQVLIVVQVTDAMTGEPLRGVVVQMTCESIGFEANQTTSARGQATFAGIEVLTFAYELVATADGYQDAAATITVEQGVNDVTLSMIPTPPTPTPEPTFTPTRPRPTAPPPTTAPPAPTAPSGFNGAALRDRMVRLRWVLEQMGGLLDRVYNGQAGSCPEFTNYYQQVSSIERFPSVPASWQGVYNEYIWAADNVRATNESVYSLCLSGGGVLSNLNYGVARTGVLDSLTHLIPAIEAANALLGG